MAPLSLKLACCSLAAVHLLPSVSRERLSTHYGRFDLVLRFFSPLKDCFCVLDLIIWHIKVDKSPAYITREKSVVFTGTSGYNILIKHNEVKK